jgi:hypothetical protein
LSKAALQQQYTTMSTSSSQGPYELNTLAISLLESKMTLDAASTFRKALSALKTQIRLTRSQDEARTVSTSESEEYLSYRVVDKDTGRMSDLTSPYNQFELFAYGFDLLDTLHAIPQELEQEIVCCVTLYNLGLSFHLLAVEKNMSKYFREAMRFYSLSYENFEALRDHLFSAHVDTQNATEGASLEAFCTPNISVFLLTLINNIAHIKSHFFEGQAVQRCIDELKYLIVYTHQSSAQDERIDIFDSVVVRLNFDARLLPAAAA